MKFECERRGEHIWMAIHSSNTKIAHKTSGAECECLPEICCATCNGLLLEMGNTSPRKEIQVLSHVYPAWVACADGSPTSSATIIEPKPNYS